MTCTGSVRAEVVRRLSELSAKYGKPAVSVGTLPVDAGVVLTTQSWAFEISWAVLDATNATMCSSGNGTSYTNFDTYAAAPRCFW